MSADDPFASFDGERTLIKPSAGRGARSAPAPVAAPLPSDTGTPLPSGTAEALPIPGLNPLLAAATPLLRLGPRLRSTVQLADPPALRASLVEALRRFETATRAAGLPNEQVVAGRYVLCSFLDECASSTPWGGSGAWSSQSLLVHFHNESWGGEKLFQLMGKLAEDVPKNRSLLELLDVVLALGFEGRYRVLDGGRAQLDSVRERLVQLLRQGAAGVDRELSPQWAGAPAGDARLRDGLPVWVAAAATALLLMGAFTALRFSADGHSDAAFHALQTLDAKGATPAVAASAPVPAAAPRLAGLLQPDITAGRVEVRDFADRSVVVLRGSEFFEPGSADVAAAAKPLIGRIAVALARLPGPVVVAGHTDNQPIRSLRFPSNWHLSQARAAAVQALLAETVPAERLRAEGRADAMPVDDNATAAGRARNRRVEITLAAAPGG